MTVLGCLPFFFLCRQVETISDFLFSKLILFIKIFRLLWREIFIYELSTASLPSVTFPAFVDLSYVAPLVFYHSDQARLL